MSSLSSTTEKPPVSETPKGRKRSVCIVLLAILGVLAVCALGYFSLTGAVADLMSGISMPWWGMPAFWASVIFVAILVRYGLARKMNVSDSEPDITTEAEVQDGESLPSPPARQKRKFKARLFLLGAAALIAILSFSYAFLSGRFQTPDLPSWSVPVFWCLVLALAVVPYLRGRVSRKREETDTASPVAKEPFRLNFKIGKRFIVISFAALAALGLIAGIAYAFASGALSVSDIPAWSLPLFWCTVLAAAVSPKIYQSIAHRKVREGNVDESDKIRSDSPWKINRAFGTKAALSVIVILLFGLLANLYFAGKLVIPGFSWWGGAAFWALAVAIVTAPRIYLSLPSVAQSAKRSAGGIESTTWLLLLGGLFLVNAVLIRSPEAQDAFFVDLTRFFDTRFFTAWHWCLFLLGTCGYFVAYILNTRIIVAEHEEHRVSNLVFATKLAGIVGSTGAALFVATKFSLFEPLIRMPFSGGFPVRYWSIIWVALALEIVLLLHPNLRQEVRGLVETNITGPLKSFSWRIVPLLVFGIAFVGGIAFLFVSGTVRPDEMPWWTGPAFWSLVIAAALSPKIYAALPKRRLSLRPQGTARTLPKPGLKTFLLAALALIPVGLVAGIGYAFYSGTVKWADLPSWTVPAFWSSIIVLGITYRVVESVRAYLKDAGPRRRSVKAKESTKTAPGFNTATKRRGFQRSGDGFSLFETVSNLGPLVWAIPVGIVAVSIIGYLGYSLLTMQRLDADGHPIPMPGWVIPAISGLVILAVVVGKIVMVLRENAGSSVRSSSRSVQKPKSAKPVGFNANVKQKTVRSGSGFSWPSLPDFSGLRELGPIIGLVLLGVAGLAVLGFIAYFLSTMQWLDEDGHPVSMPTWIWPLLCLLVALGAVAWKVVMALRENSGGSFRSRQVRSAPTRPAGFNARGNPFGKKKSGFNRSSDSDNLFANPMLWLGLLGGAVVLLLLVIILILVF